MFKLALTIAVGRRLMFAINDLAAGKSARSAGAGASRAGPGGAVLRLVRSGAKAHHARYRRHPGLRRGRLFDRVHGAQQLRSSNACYDNYSFQPIVEFDAEGRFIRELLRPGKRPSGVERIIARVEARPQATDTRYIATNLEGAAPSASTSGSIARVARPKTISRRGKKITSPPTAPHATPPRPTGSACSCTPAATGSCG
jgi:hypothetical protein